MSKSVSTSGGIGLGSILAGIISWVTNHSIGWLIIHALLGWLYVFYYIVFYLFPWGIFLKILTIGVIAIILWAYRDKIKNVFK